MRDEAPVDDIEHVESHRDRARRATPRLRVPMAEVHVPSTDISVLGRSYACTLTAEQYRRTIGTGR